VKLDHAARRSFANLEGLKSQLPARSASLGTIRVEHSPEYQFGVACT
jgi:hypothetical protein